jgi:hypothetical protein
MEAKMNSNQGIIVNGGTLNGRAFAVGKQATLTYTDTGTSDVLPVDVAALRAALKELRAELVHEPLSDDALIAAQTSAGQALMEGLKDDQVQPEKLQEHIRGVGETLKASNVVVQEGSALWRSVQTLMPLLAPVVAGGARVVAAWFGIIM